MNATEYMTDKGLHALIRDPKSVRSWPGMKMQGWPPDLLSDRHHRLSEAHGRAEGCAVMLRQNLYFNSSISGAYHSATSALVRSV